MTLTWRPEAPRAIPRPGPGGWLRATARGLPLMMLLGGGLAALLALRLVERPLFHPRRPWTPWITVSVCRAALRLLGLRVRRSGPPLAPGTAVLANHASWLDIFALNAEAPLVFVAKSEVAGWPGIGWLARATGTLFVRREARGEAAAQVALIRERLARSERVVLFPEGTSSDGLRVLPFKPALLAAVPPGGAVQPVTVAWRAPEGEDPRFYAWFGGEGFGPHALAVLAVRRPGGVVVTRHPALPAGDRKALARAAEEAVRSALR